MRRARRPVPNFKLYGESFENAPDFWVHCETIPERTRLHNFEISAHKHDGFFQIFLVTAGSGELLEAEESRRFSAPCVLFVPPGAPHGFRFARDVDGLVATSLADRLATVAAADRRIAEFTSKLRLVPLEPGNADADMAIDALSAVQAERSRSAVGRSVLLEALVTTAVVGLARAAGTGSATAGGADDRASQRIEQLLGLIGAHFLEHRPIGFYAARVGVSPTHLNRLARTQTGLSVQGLIARRLLDAAQRDLVFTPSPVQKVAYSLGFSDPAYFNRFFRRMTGTTPGAFRERERMKLAA